MSEQAFSRRHFFYGTLLAGAVPAGGFGSVPALTQLGYKSPNERINLAAIGAGGQPFGVLRNAVAGVENVVALTDVDFARGAQGFSTYPKAEKYRDYRRMLDRQAKEIDAVVIGTADHMHATCALACMQLGKHVYVEKPLTRTAWEARLLTQAAAKYPRVATQMGNQGYSHDATRVACEIIWSGEIGDVSEVHAWTGRASWPQGMTKIPPPTPIPETLDWDLWLGGAAWREYTAGDKEYLDFVAERNARSGRGMPQAMPARAAGEGGAQADPARGARAGGGGFGGQQYGFYLPFNWRGFYDFGSGLIGDWGIHILGPANWALQLDPKYLISVECIKKDSLPPFTFPDELTIKYEFGPRPGMPPVTVYWYHAPGGNPYMPPGMTVEEARQIPGQGPQVGPARGQGGFFPGTGGAAPGQPPAGGQPQAARAGGQQAGLGYNSIFVGSKGYLGTSGRGEGVGLLPGSRWAEYRLPNAYLPRSPGATTGDNSSAHARDWIRACKGGAPACSNFNVAGPYTEWLVLGAAAIHAQGRLMWDNARGEFTNGKQVMQWVRPTFRKGWEIRL